MNNFTLIVVALALDARFGEPDWLWSRFPHPVKIIGLGISYLDQKLNFGSQKRIKGVAALLLLLAVIILFGWVISELPFGWIFEVIVAAILIGHRSLVQHVSAVASSLNVGIKEGRQAVSMIVGRDTKDLDESAVARGAIESAAENFSDGVVAPVFWFLLFGLPGIAAYKLVNTADSMIGYRNERYLEFGWAAARLDDVMNFIPARLSAVLITITTLSASILFSVQKEAQLHRSPNAGWPEAAMARALGVALSGPRSYDGAQTDDAYVNPEGRRNLGCDDIEKSVRVLWQSWAVLLGMVILFQLGAWLGLSSGLS